MLFCIEYNTELNAFNFFFNESLSSPFGNPTVAMFLYVFVLLLVGGIVEKLSPTLGGLINLVAVGLEIYAIYLITHIAKSAYNYKITGKERLSFAQERDENL